MIIPEVLESEEVYKGRITSIRRDTLTRETGRHSSVRRQCHLTP